MRISSPEQHDPEDHAAAFDSASLKLAASSCSAANPIRTGKLFIADD
jgi:hypothetical protein